MATLETPDGICPPGMCERCFSMHIYSPAIIVHHIRHLTPQNIGDPETTLGFDNLQRLCRDCHAFVHGGADEPRMRFDENGVPYQSRPETLESLVVHLTETQDEKRNIHKED